MTDVRRAAFNPLIRPYLVLYGALLLVVTIVGIPLAVVWLLGVGQWWARHYFDRLECELSPTALRFRKGIVFQVEKTIPLENIQDVTFIEGPLLRAFHLSVLKLETAGQSPGQGHAMSLVGIVDAHEYRAAILAAREALKRAAHAPAAAPDDEQAQLLRAILDKVGEIAAVVSRARGADATVDRPARLAGGLVGLLVGDALGVPYEFKAPDALPPRAQLDFEPPPGFPRSHAAVPSGTWSDDGAQALCLLASLAAVEPFDLGDFAKRLVDWADAGYLAVDGKVFDMGIQTSRALRAIRAGVAPAEAGPRGEMDNGNGSLMRVLPLALWHRGPDAELAGLAARQSLPTHGHPRSQACCAMLCLWARRLLEGSTAPWDDAARALRACGLDADEVERVLDPANAKSVRGSGYVLDTLWSARAALDTSTDFADAVRRAVAFGNDTDTTAAVAGGLAGIVHGIDGIPAQWRTGLRGQDLLAPLLEALRRR